MAQILKEHSVKDPFKSSRSLEKYRTMPEGGIFVDTYLTKEVRELKELTLCTALYKQENKKGKLEILKL